MKKYGYIALAIYAASIPLANWFIQHVGEQAFPGGPHTIPVGFGYDAPSGVLWIGVALVARDIVQRCLGRSWAVGAIAAGAVLSYFVAPNLAWASAIAFGLGELADFAVYTPLERKHLRLAVLASGVVGALIDSLIFLELAFGSTMFWQGNTLGKIYMSIAALPFLGFFRRRTARPAMVELDPANVEAVPMKGWRLANADLTRRCVVCGQSYPRMFLRLPASGAYCTPEGECRRVKKVSRA